MSHFKGPSSQDQQKPLNAAYRYCLAQKEGVQRGIATGYDIIGLGGGGGREWVRERKGEKVTYWLGGGGGLAGQLAHTHTQGTVHFSLHNEHTSCIMARGERGGWNLYCRVQLELQLYSRVQLKF